MSPPDAERGAATAPRPDQATTQRISRPQRTAIAPTVDRAGVLLLPVELEDLLDRREQLGEVA